MGTGSFKPTIYFFYRTKPETDTTGTASACRGRKAKRDAQTWMAPAAKTLYPTTPNWGERRYGPSLGFHSRVAGWAAVRSGSRITAGTTG